MSRDPQIIERLILTADLELASPLLIGTGENDNLTDTLVLKNKNGMPFIPGTSLAGVLKTMDSSLEKYFGVFTGKKNSKDESQSTYVVSDIELDRDVCVIRDSVRIDAETGVAAKQGKFDYEAVERGAKGKVKIAAFIRGWQKDEAEAIKAGLEELGTFLQNEVFIGAHTRRGFGKIVCKNVFIDDYDFTKAEAVKAWILGKPAPCRKAVKKADVYAGGNFVMDVEAAIRGSLMVRTSDFKKEDYAKIINKDTKTENKKVSKIDNVQMKSGNDYVIPGSSVRGVLRKQALKIMRVLGKDEAQLDKLFGYSENKESQRGRVITEEVYFKQGVKSFKQVRNKIDRFTCSTIDGALVTSIPVTQSNSDKPTLKFRIIVEKCEAWEAGLMLFLLKDLWTGRIAFGGEKSIGRGTVDGFEATIRYDGKTVGITASAGKLLFSTQQDESILNDWAQSLAEL